MPTKHGIGIGVPFSDGRGGGSSVALSDGYYFQFDLIDPRTLAGWLPTLKFHDHAERDVTTAEDGAPGVGVKRTNFLVVKAAGMTIDQITPTPGYQNTYGDGGFWGSNDGVVWALMPVVNDVPVSHVVYGYNTSIDYAISTADMTTFGPYIYIAGTFSDTGGAAPQSGLADLRLKLAGVDVGPA